MFASTCIIYHHSFVCLFDFLPNVHGEQLRSSHVGIRLWWFPCFTAMLSKQKIPKSEKIEQLLR